MNLAGEFHCSDGLGLSRGKPTKIAGLFETSLALCSKTVH
jgi:hypothetical protein